ncbi:MAG: tRNA 2-thiouridine(34) synthase MnmA [Coriobacteriales bacterium]|jgi:tRNA-specific 2-thiouridylase
MSRVLVAMSGGVDSSVAAHLLQSSGYECIGVTMRLCDEPRIADAIRGSGFEPVPVERDAREVAERLGIQHHVVDMGEKFAECVVGPFVDSYLAGRTPNPCVDCNKALKFGALLDLADELGCDYISTGHYAQIRWVPGGVGDSSRTSSQYAAESSRNPSQQGGRFILSRAAHVEKDQSYMLYHLTQEQLSRVLLPLGSLSKDEVRAIALDLGFSNANKHDSQDLCFVPDGDYASFIERYSKVSGEPGDILDTGGNVVGRHSGIWRYTIGQRKGLGLSMGRPVYVCDKNAESNTLTVGPRESLLTTGCEVGNWNWIMPCPDTPVRAMVKTYYRQKPIAATVIPNSDGSVVVEYSEPGPKAVPGQSAVAYVGDDVLGGGVVQRAIS